MRARTRIGLAMLAATILIVPATAGAQIDNSDREALPVTELPERDDDNPGPPIEELEAPSYANDFDVTVEEAARRLRRADELIDVINQVVENEGDRVAGYSIVHEPEFGAWIYLVGDEAPTRRSIAVQRAEGDVMIETGAAHTLDELISAAANKTELLSVLPADMRARIAYTDIDVYNNSFVVVIDEDSPASREGGASELASLDPTKAAEAVQELLSLRSEVAVIVSTGPGDSEAQGVYPGENIHLTNNASCTSGFTVQSTATSPPTRGLTTSGHCSFGTNLDEHFRSRTTAETGLSYNATEQGAVYNSLMDALWYTTGAWESDDFYINANATRDVTGFRTRVQMQGAYVCHYGISSNSSCGNVTSIFHAPPASFPNCAISSTGCENRWIRVEGPSLEACPGDSGGPVFNWRTAYGLLATSSGTSCTASGTNFMTFVAMDHVLAKLGVDLVTN